MATDSSPMHATKRQAEQAIRQTMASRGWSALARPVYAAKGVVYVIVGVLAVRTAVGAGGRAGQHARRSPGGRDGAIRLGHARPDGSQLVRLRVMACRPSRHGPGPQRGGRGKKKQNPIKLTP